jgi:hypothetical protein
MDKSHGVNFMFDIFSPFTTVIVPDRRVSLVVSYLSVTVASLLAAEHLYLSITFRDNS